jgi:pimeloyl-ACP methyl ester carboxylesterase
MRRPVRHLSLGTRSTWRRGRGSVAAAALIAAAIVVVAPAGPVVLARAPRTQAATATPIRSGEGTSRFIVLLRGVRIGSEEVDVTRPGGGLKISSSNQLAPPFDLITHKFEMTYTADGQPQSLSIEATMSGQPLMLSTSFGLTTASSDMLQGQRRGSATHPITPRTVVLPRNTFGAYEILAARVAALTAGARVPLYLAPEGEVHATIDRVSERRVSGPAGQTTLRQVDFTVAQPQRPTPIEIWVDDRGRLARLSIPSASLTVIRDDIASVMVREEKVRHRGDEDVFVPASGFSLAATITRSPAAAADARLPVVIFVGSPGRQDRDEVHYGMPVFGLLAGELAEAGYLAVRYDKRGVGQSGGRTEHATLNEYAEDVLAIVNWARRRRDVDRDRVALVAHGEGGAVALIAAREDRIKAVALLAAPGATGREVTLEQQQRALATLKETEADKQAKIDLQRRIIEAAITGNGWEAIPPDVRRQADTPWFRSWLLFDPAKAIEDVDAPMLIVHGSLDQEMPVSYADRLERWSGDRRNDRPELTSKVVLDGVNHLLMPARTGDVDEYAALDKTLAPAVVSALKDWLARTLPPRR